MAGRSISKGTRCGCPVPLTTRRAPTHHSVRCRCRSRPEVLSRQRVTPVAPVKSAVATGIVRCRFSHSLLSIRHLRLTREPDSLTLQSALPVGTETRPSSNSRIGSAKRQGQLKQEPRLCGVFGTWERTGGVRSWIRSECRSSPSPVHLERCPLLGSGISIVSRFQEFIMIQ